jgi:chromosome segregation ATPase
MGIGDSNTIFGSLPPLYPEIEDLEKPDVENIDTLAPIENVENLKDIIAKKEKTIDFLNEELQRINAEFRKVLANSQSREEYIGELIRKFQNALREIDTLKKTITDLSEKVQ